MRQRKGEAKGGKGACIKHVAPDPVFHQTVHISPFASPCTCPLALLFMLPSKTKGYQLFLFPNSATCPNAPLDPTVFTIQCTRLITEHTGSGATCLMHAPFPLLPPLCFVASRVISAVRRLLQRSLLPASLKVKGRRRAGAGAERGSARSEAGPGRR